MKTSNIEKSVKVVGMLMVMTALVFIIVPMLIMYTGKIYLSTNNFHDLYVVISPIALLLASLFIGLGVFLILYAKKIAPLIQSKFDL